MSLPPALLVPLLLGGCASRQLLRLENQVLVQELERVHAELATCQSDAPPQDFATEVSVEVVADYLARAGFTGVERLDNDLLVVGIEGSHTRFKLTAQLFQRESVLYLAATDYLRLEDATSSSNMVLLLTQLASLNYDLLLGKFQLNPKSGEITLSVELNLDDGLGFKTFEAVSHHLVQTADGRYPELARAAGGGGM
ncbi:YbjN domain-containing protein [Myxococcota bacterium]|nr:YbjN domain-containing protein [Myxococcota bacterium]